MTSTRTRLALGVLACVVFAGCEAQASPTPTVAPADAVPNAIVPHAPETLIPALTASPLRSPTPSLTQETDDVLDFTYLTITLEDLPTGFIAVGPTVQLFFSRGDTIPMINQDVERDFGYREPQRGQIIFGALYSLEDSQQRAWSDAMMPYAVEAYVASFANTQLETVEKISMIDDLADVAIGRHSASDSFASVEGLMLRRGVVGSFILVASVQDPTELSIVEMAKILDSRIRESVPYDGWLTQDRATAPQARLILSEINQGEVFCRFLFESEGFGPEAELYIKLTEPDGTVRIDTSVLVASGNTLAFDFGQQDSVGLWGVELIGDDQSAAYVVRWSGECTEF